MFRKQVWLWAASFSLMSWANDARAQQLHSVHRHVAHGGHYGGSGNGHYGYPTYWYNSYSAIPSTVIRASTTPRMAIPNTVIPTSVFGVSQSLFRVITTPGDNLTMLLG